MLESRILFCLGIVSLLIFAGCGNRDDFKLSYGDLHFEERQSVSFPTNAPKLIARMASNDVIVAVNGYPLRKHVYDDLMDMKMKGLLENNKEANNVIISEQMEQHRKSYVRNFQGQRMLVDEAFRLGLISTNEVLEIVTKRLKEEARKRGKTVEESLKKYGDRRKYVFQEMFVSTVMDRLISKKIPPKHEVSSGLVAAVQRQITLDNEAAEVTNRMLKVRLQDWKNQILTNKLDFLTVAQRFSQNPDPDGIWGEFETDGMDDPRIEGAVFAMPLNGISDVLEDDNGYHLVKVLAIIPPEKDEKGEIVVKERRKLSHIYWEKIPLSMRSTDVVLTQDLKRQMQMQAINEYITCLSTNGTTRIEYPNGIKLF